MNPLTQSKNTTILPVLIVLTLGCFALSPQARAVCQEGCLSPETTVLGEGVLLSNTGFNNTGIGFFALSGNTTGFSNTATGSFALYGNTTGFSNTAIGKDALHSNTIGFSNTATGVGALASSTTGNHNTAIGFYALILNTSGFSNTAMGAHALVGNDTGSHNTAIGFDALNSNDTGGLNTANGDSALFRNRSGNFNTAMGESALLENHTGNGNTASGVLALGRTTGSFNIALGTAAGFNLTTGDNNIDIGNEGVAAEANTIRIGTQGTQTATYIAGISGTALRGGVAVRVDANGQLGTVGSSVRFKQNIKPMDRASEAIHALKPVTFRYKDELDPDGIPQFGLVAEDVERVNPALVARDVDGKPYTVRYEAVNAMLLNEFLKEHRRVEDLEGAVASLAATVKEQAAQIQKVSAQVEVSKFAAGRIRRGGPAPQMVDNNQ